MVSHSLVILDCSVMEILHRLRHEEEQQPYEEQIKRRGFAWFRPNVSAVRLIRSAVAWFVQSNSENVAHGLEMLVFGVTRSVPHILTFGTRAEAALLRNCRIARPLVDYERYEQKCVDRQIRSLARHGAKAGGDFR